MINRDNTVEIQTTNRSSDLIRTFEFLPSKGEIISTINTSFFDDKAEIQTIKVAHNLFKIL